MYVQRTNSQSMFQVDLTAPRSYASTARQFMEAIRIPDFPSSDWTGACVLPGSPEYHPIQIEAIEPIRLSDTTGSEHIDVKA